MGKINDFGKVIEGARKDLWKSPGVNGRGYHWNDGFGKRKIRHKR